MLSENTEDGSEQPLALACVLCSHMPSPHIQKIHLCSDTAFLTSLIQAYLLWQLSFLQHVYVAVMQLSGYSIFHKCQDHWRWTSFFLFSLFTLFFFFFFFSFLFVEQLRLGFISHAVTSVTSWWHSHKTDHRTWENGVKDSGIKWCYTTWTTHVGLMSYIWLFRVGCTVVSTDHE